jgi:BirA family biotin operon repressor/biotin-[acetyl-CoA-carboxylase] ligase
MIHYKEQTASTNDDARSEELRHMDVVWAEYQTAGRGQRGHTWHSSEGENITLSVVLEPTFLPIVEQFLLSEIAALALVDTMRDYGIECRIKWTNDIYVGDNKLVGILIEHSLIGDKLSRTIVGMGINVNQHEFPTDIPNPTSMALERGIRFDRKEVIERLMSHLDKWFELLRSGEKSYVEQRYREQMYHLDEEHTYAYPTGEHFRATLRGVRASGELRLEHEDGIIREYAFKEVEFVLRKKKVL